MEERLQKDVRLPISEYQKRFFLEWALLPNESLYNVSNVNKLIGDVDIELLKTACEVFIQKNEIVFAQFSDDGKQCNRGDFCIEDFYFESTFNEIGPIESQIKDILYTPFDLTNGPLLRLYLIKAAGNEHEIYFIFVAHHIICDAIWMTQFHNQIQDVYNRLSNEDLVSFDINKTFTLAVEAVQKGLTHVYRNKSQKFWLDFIGDLPLNIDLPYRSNVNAINRDNFWADKAGECIYFDLNSIQSEDLRTYAKQKNTTLFIVLSALYGFVLSKFINQKRFLISYPVNMRPKEFREVTGCFVNNIPMKFDFTGVQSLDRLVEVLMEQRKEVREYQGYSLSDIINDQRRYNDSGNENVLNAGFTQSYLNVIPFELQGLKAFPVDISWSKNSIHEIELLYDALSSAIKFKLEYRKLLFNADLIHEFINSFKKVVKELTSGKEIIIKNYSVLRPAVYDEIVSGWNKTDKAYRDDRTIHELFEEQSAKTPDNIALVYEGDELSYEELNARSNQLARHIREQYLQRTGEAFKPDTLIALCLDRSLEMVIGILGVLKAGGAYVPLDPDYPQERIDYLLSDTGAELVLSHRGLSAVHTIALPEGKVVYIDLSEALYRQEDTSNLPPQSGSKDLAYVIYTSGTTGRPKGVMVGHSGIVNRLEWMQSMYPVKAKDVVLQKTPYVFDVSVWEILWANWYGAKIVLAKPGGHKDSEYLYRLIESNKITTLHFVPGMLEAYNHYLTDQQVKFHPSVKNLFCSGESLPEHVVDHSYQNAVHPSFRLNNLYGPTEASIDVTFFETLPHKKVYIGRPLDNTQVYVLDGNMVPVPVGVTGELYIGGAGLSRGYLNNAELTASRFIANPFATDADRLKGYTRLYKTGDLVRWHKDGNLEYIGRNDDQVKIRGYRIELGEVEHALSQVAGIRQSCVVAKERQTESGSTKYLVGYYILDSNYVSAKDSDILDNWENLYDAEYEKSIEEEKITADFTGWNSYVSGDAIPLAEMYTWRDDIVGIIKSLSPVSVLEIGVGSGLLMYPLLSAVQSYTGLDISRAVIERHKRYVETKNYNVALYHLKADELDDLPEGELYDVIVVNSVCQYFPGIRYFNEMLDKAIGRLSATGSIFLGDIRNYDLHKELIKEKFDYRGEDYTQHDINRIALKENELLISPSYFTNLGKRYRHLKVTVLQRGGSYVNELSRYRYDVVISRADSNEIAREAIEDFSGEVLTAASMNSYNIPFLNQLSKDSILQQLSAVLPEYMLPGALVLMESFPLTINGKLDKRGLPDPEFSSSDQYVAPVTAIELSVSRIWEEVLGLERVGVTDDFFRIGGDSILSIQVSSRIRQAGFNCLVKDIFFYKSIRALSVYLSNAESEISIKSEQGLLAGEFDLLPVQQWFTDCTNSGAFGMPNHWNQSFLIKVPVLDRYILSSVMADLCSYHDMLRVVYIKGDRWQQMYQPGIVLPEFKTLDVSRYTAVEIEGIFTDWQRGFDLEKGPLFQAGYLYGYEDGSARIYLALHHMIVDGVSWRILLDDIRTLYSGKVLPAKGSSYRQWTKSIRSYAVRHPEEAFYWQRQLEGIRAPHLVRDQQDSISAGIVILDKAVTTVLLQQASGAYHTEVNDLLLTALAYALKDINQSEVQNITLEGHGREDIDPLIDCSRTVGWFTSMFPVRLQLQGSLRDSIRSIKESLRTIPNKGVGFGAFATERNTVYSYDDLPLITFNYLGQFDGQQDGWQIVAEGSGMNMHPGNTDRNLININGMVSNGKLEFSIVTRLGEQTTNHLSGSLEMWLISIIEHCKEKLEGEGSSYTPSDFKTVHISQSLLDVLQSKAQATQNNIRSIYAANSLQQGFIYHALSQSEDEAYRVQIVYDFYQAIDIGKYIQAWEACIARYPILRTAFNWEEEIIQVIYQEGKLEYHIHDISDLPNQQAKDTRIGSIRASARQQGFDLTQPTLLRLHIIKQSTDYYTVIKTEHHIIADGWSGPILLTSVHQYYQALTRNEKLSIQEDTAYPAAQDYISSHKEGIADYWDKMLEGVNEANDIGALLSEPIDTVHYKRVEQPAVSVLELRGEIYDQVKSFIQTEGITMNVIVQFMWHKLVQVYSNSVQSIVGTTVSGRDLPIEGIEKSVGLYINTLPLVIDWENDNTIQDQLHEFHERITALNTHSFADLAKLQKEGRRVFQSLFVFENYPLPEADEKNTLKISMRDYADGVDYALSIVAYEQNHTVTVKLQYDGLYLTKDLANEHIASLEHILQQILENPKRLHRKLSVLRPAVYDEIVSGWNKTDKAYRDDRTIHELFEEQSAKTPDNIALVYEGDELSYEELNARSNQLARHIREQYLQRTGEALKPDTLIALCLDRSLEMVIGILGVLKAGGAYVPLDPDYPQERVDYLLSDTGAELVLSHRGLSAVHTIALPEGKVVYIDLSEALYRQEDTSNLPPQSGSKDLAYVIYTSGTTGRPKGVMLEHFSLCNRILHIISCSAIISSDFHLFKTNYVFDASFFEMFTHLCVGAKLQVTKYLFEIHELNGLLFNRKFTSLHLVPSQYDLVSSVINSIGLQKIYFSGEALTAKILSSITDKSIKIYNYYGPTELGEITVFNPLIPANATVIGKLFPNCRQYVLDSNRVPVPVGVTGELYIGGAGLSRGYLNNAELTASRFIANPFATDADRLKGYTRLYKTGDLVRWHKDGNLEYIGRNDDQVKIRGYRIELGEIEHALSQVAGVRQSCVVAKEKQTGSGSTKYLVGYYILDSEAVLTQDSILQQLSAVLPEYMLPGALVLMESFPLTINGKLDKRGLPDPEFSSSDQYVAPVTAVELSVSRIWEEMLGLERVGMTDDFFRIGGDSILAIRVSHQMSKALGCEIRVADVFKYKTLEQLLVHSLGQAQIMIPVTDTAVSVLSYAQERLWFIEQYEQGTNAYHMPAVFELGNGTDAGGIKYALGQVVLRHEVLRSTIEQGESQHGVQVVHESPLEVEEVDLSSEEDVEALLREDINRPFDLSRSYPIRVKFYRLVAQGAGDGGRIILLVNMHHIASDGWSMEIFQRELFAYYESYVNKEVDFRLPALEIQYKDYAQWQRSYLSGELLDKQLIYWKDKLAGYQTLALPVDYTRPPEIDYRGAAEIFTISSSTSEKLRGLAQRYGVTLHSVLLSSINILLGKYTGQDDIVTGSPTANRHYRQTEGLIGFFVNTQVNRTLLSKSGSYADLIREVHEEQVAAQLHQDLPFESLVDELGVERDVSRHPVFQVWFVVQSFGNDGTITGKQKDYLRPFGGTVGYEIEKFDLSVFVDDSHQELMVQMSYATALFSKQTIAGLSDHYQYLLDQLTASPDIAYSGLSLLRPAVYDEIVSGWNKTDKAYRDDRTIHELFEEQSAKTPDNIALVYEGDELSYEELNARSNQLARHIREQYLQRTGEAFKPDTLIALCLDRSLEMVIGILGVLKAGGAYVPLDPDYPQERIDYLLSDTGAELVLSHRGLSAVHTIALPEGKVVYIDLSEALYRQEDTSNLPPQSGSKDLAYVIYTSGTTGRPKGVMLEHFSVCNRVLHIISHSAITASDFYLFKTNYVFDVSFSDMFTHLCVGAKLQITKYLFRISELNRLLFNRKFTSLHLVPSQYDLVSSVINSIGLQKIYFSGEALTAKILSSITDKSIKIYNYYGPTELGEITVFNPLIPANATVIGKLFPNCRQYVLDSNRVPVPVGVTGELYIGGAGLSRGYLNNAELTASRFIANPFATDADRLKGYTRLYKTGDLVRWHKDGNLEYIGRNDDQVKIHGYRIELGEIEHALSQVAGIRQSCVVAKERQTGSGSTKYLVGYYILDSEVVLTQEQILDKLSLVLPEYMLPGALVLMESFPLTINGKLDKRGLPDPEFSSSAQYVAPVTDIEKTLCCIWEEVLGLERVGVTDDFFRIGGNSILAIRIIGRINKILSIEIKVKELFLNATVELINKILKKKKHTQESLLHIGLNIQATTFPGKDNLYNTYKSQEWRYLKYKFNWEGQYTPMNLIIHKELIDANQKALFMAVDTMVSRHESLRTIFTYEQGVVLQKICTENEFTNIILEDISLLEDKEETIKSIVDKMYNHLFDFSNEQSFKCKLIKHDKNKYTFIFVIDHIISDSDSLRIIEEELFTIYNAYCKNLPNPLKPLKLQLKEYACYHNQHYKGDKLAYHQSYFDKIFKDHPSKPIIKYGKTPFNNQEEYMDFKRSNVSAPLPNSEVGGYIFAISKETLDKIHLITSQMKISIFNFLLAAYSVFLSKISHQNDFVIDSPMTTRNNEDFSKIIGWLIGTLVSRVIIKDKVTFNELLLMCKNNIMESLEHIYYQAYGAHENVEWNELATQLNIIYDNDKTKKNLFDFKSCHYKPQDIYFDISFTITIFKDGAAVNCRYKTEIIDPPKIAEICEYFNEILIMAVNKPNVRINKWMGV